MSQLIDELGDSESVVATAAALGELAIKPHELKHGAVYAVRDADGGVQIKQIDPKPEQLRPHSISGAPIVHDPESFVDYVKRHYTRGTEVYADRTASTIVAILDSNYPSDGDEEDGQAGHRDHRLTLQLAKTPSWLSWAANDGKWLEQVAFAEHIEENLADVAEPTAADFLEIAQTFQATRGVDFSSSTRLSSGETQLRYAESLDGRAGRSGTIDIPEGFVLGLIPYVGGSDTYRVNARFRYRLREASLVLGYKLDRPERVLEAAFEDILNVVKTGLEPGIPVFHGRP